MSAICRRYASSCVMAGAISRMSVNGLFPVTCSCSQSTISASVFMFVLSFRFDARVAHDLRPLGELGRDERGERARRAADGLEPERLQRLAHVARLERLHDLA